MHTSICMAACAFAIDTWADDIYIYIYTQTHKLINIFSTHLTQISSYHSAMIFHHLTAKKNIKNEGPTVRRLCLFSRSSFSESFSVPLGAKTNFTLFLSERVEIG